MNATRPTVDQDDRETFDGMTPAEHQAWLDSLVPDDGDD